MRKIRLLLAVPLLAIGLAVPSTVAAEQPACASAVYGWNTVELPVGFWPAGPNTATFLTAIGPYSTTFDVDKSVPVVPGQVSITWVSLDPLVLGLLSINGPVSAINPAQDTEAMDLWWFPDRSIGAAMWSDPYTTASLQVGPTTVDMRHSPLMSACTGGFNHFPNGAFHRSFGPKYKG